jgi:hypothetical protein
MPGGCSRDDEEMTHIEQKAILCRNGFFCRGFWVELPDGQRRYSDSTFQKVYEKIHRCPHCGVELVGCESSRFFRCRECGYGFSIAKFKIVARMK